MPAPPPRQATTKARRTYRTLSPRCSASPAHTPPMRRPWIGRSIRCTRRTPGPAADRGSSYGVGTRSILAHFWRRTRVDNTISGSGQGQVRVNPDGTELLSGQESLHERTEHTRTADGDGQVLFRYQIGRAHV